MEVELVTNNYHLEEIKTTPKNYCSTNVDKSIRKLVEREGFIVCKIDKKCLSANGDNYLGTLYEINVKGQTKEGNKEINIFVKQSVDTESVQLVSVTDVYNTEIFAYTELSNIFAALQEEANVPEEERYKMVKIYDESSTEMLIMENLAKKGFTTYYRMDDVPLKFIEKSVQYIARFHALSFVLEKKRPEYFNKKLKPMKYGVSFDDVWAALIKQLRDTTVDHIEGELKDKVSKAYMKAMTKLPQYHKDKSTKACLVHGDYRPNNILVKIKEGEIQELMPVDYQLLHYGCPVFDFLYIIYVGTDRAFRLANMSNLKDLYYETFSHFLKYFDLEADLLYSRKEFEKVYEEKKDFGMMTGLTGIIFLFASDDHLIDISQKQAPESIRLDDRFRHRLQGIIEDLEEFGNF